MWEPKLRTPGIACSSFAAATEMRTCSSLEVSGLVTQCMRKSRSLNSGSSSCPRRGTTSDAQEHA